MPCTLLLYRQARRPIKHCLIPYIPIYFLSEFALFHVNYKPPYEY